MWHIQKRSPGIDKATKLTYHLSTKAVGGEKKGMRLHLVIMNRETIPVGCTAGVMIAFYFLYMPSSTSVLTGTLCSFWQDGVGWGGVGGCPEVMTISCGSCNLHDKQNPCFAACYKCLLRPWSDTGRKTDVSFHAMFSNSHTQTHKHTHSVSDRPPLNPEWWMHLIPFPCAVLDSPSSAGGQELGVHKGSAGDLGF